MSTLAQVRDELEKAATMVGAARRLLATGTMVDLSALEGKIRFICESVVGLDRPDGQDLLAGMEALIADLDRLSQAIHERHEPPAPSGAP
ncbi:MAG: hypothetical protein ACM33T_02590 [Solirubrobacterales bacterium]